MLRTEFFCPNCGHHLAYYSPQAKLYREIHSSSTVAPAVSLCSLFPSLLSADFHECPASSHDRHRPSVICPNSSLYAARCVTSGETGHLGATQGCLKVFPP
jgi:hypothetical protein